MISRIGHGFGLRSANFLKSSAYFFGRITRFACAYPPHIPAVGSVISPSRIFFQISSGFVVL